MSTVICEAQTGSKWTRISFSYSTEIVDVIKALPMYHRYFVAEDKMWRVCIGSVSRLGNILRGLGHEFAVIDWAPPYEHPTIADRLKEYRPRV